MPRDPDEPSIISAYGIPELTKTDASGRAAQNLARLDERYITEEFGPLLLSPGEVYTAINTKEAGELIYVKVVTDNAYARVLLELDDYRNDENGETAANLIYDQRTDRADGQFYVINGGAALGYGMIFNPQKSESYSYKLRLQVKNDLKRSNLPFGFNLNYTSPGGLPTPILPSFIGGGSFVHPGLTDVTLDTFSKAMAKPIGAVSYAADAIFNDAVFNDDSLTLGAGSPFEGIAGKPLFRRDKASFTTTPPAGELRGAQVVAGTQILTPEVAALTTANGGAATVVFSTGSNPNFPGTPTSGSNTKISIFDAGGAEGLNVSCDFAVGDRLFIRNRDTVYFPGIITLVSNDGIGTNNVLTVSPGLSQLPPTVSIALDTETTTFGTLATHADVEPKILIKKIIIKRKRSISFEG